MNWRTLGTGVAILSAGFVPVIPDEMQYLYAYQTTPQAIQEATILANTPVTATTSEAMKRVEAPPYFEDDDKNGVISVGVFLDSNNNLIYVRIPDEQYERMGEANAPTKGFQANPVKDEYKSLIQTLLVQEAQGAVAVSNSSGITSSASGATSYTVGHTTASGDTYLATHLIDWSGDSATGCTFNGTSMTQLVKETRTPDSGSLEIYFYGLQSPAITTANVQCDRSSSTLWMSIGSVSVSGTDTASAVDATATEPGAVGQSSDTLTITTASANAGVLIGAVADNCSIAASTNATEVVGATGTPNDCSILMRSTTFPEGTAGNYTYTFTFAANSGHASVAIALKPPATPTPKDGQVIIRNGKLEIRTKATIK